ncbi:MAG: hypothetical protein FWG96_02510 [Methanomassiliicoccaceae archaeon]|nr:hypothetical protein [Methanomassiliicoccaceae archaeon]
MKRILFSRDSECLQPLLALIEKQKHRTLVLWALEYAGELTNKFETKYPDETRPREAVEISRSWARGEIKMPVAKKAILAAHNAATEISDDIVYCSMVRAVGHCCATVHVETHAIGGPIYALTAIVYERGQNNAQAAVEAECGKLCERLLFWETNVDTVQTPWAEFLLRDNVPNKEKLLREM